MSDQDKNPVVLLTDDGWHIVESSRESAAGLCGRPIRVRRAHSRLRTIGRAQVCVACLKAYERTHGPVP